jgi:hypothetical protein
MDKLLKGLIRFGSNLNKIIFFSFRKLLKSKSGLTVFSEVFISFASLVSFGNSKLEELKPYVDLASRFVVNLEGRE